MTENIELHSFLSNNTNENDIQEYHEINQDTLLDYSESSYYSKKTASPLTEYDFFTRLDVIKNHKKFTKKKKSKKTNKSSTLMDIISSEITASSVPVKENVITYMDDAKEQHNSYLEYRKRRGIKKCFFNDLEHGWRHKSQAINLGPVFPKVLENVTIETASIPVGYTGPIMYEDIINKQNLQENKALTTKFLNITLKDIKFKHHHNFSLEKLLVLKLLELYNEYETTKKLSKDLLKDIKVKKETKDNLIKDLMEINPIKKEDLRFDPIVRTYTREILELKDKYKTTVINHKGIIHKIMSLWSDIELVRDKRELIETPYILETHKEDLDEEKFEKDWNTVFNVEFGDMLDRIEYGYVSNYLEYKESKNDGKSGKKLVKPKLEIDKHTIKKDVEHLVNNIVTKEKINLILKCDKSNFNKNLKYDNICYFKIYIDDVFVCESEHYTVNDMFCSEFIEDFTVQILPNNDKLKIMLFESNNWVSTFEINMLHVKKSYISSDFTLTKFIYDTAVETNINVVGSGHAIKDIASANRMRLKCGGLFKEILKTNCEVYIKVGWNNLEQNHIETIKSSSEVGRQLKRLLQGVDKPNLDTLLDVISKIYEKDLCDNTLTETLRNLSKMEIMNDETFVINESNLDLARLKLLHLRNIGQFTDIEDKTVPLYASQISTEQLNCLQKTKEKEFDMEYLNIKEFEMDPIELQRFIGAKYLQKLNKNMLMNLNEHLLKKTHKDVVRDYDLSFRNLFCNHLVSLATLSSSTKQHILKESLNKEHEIQVTVLRAFNLPDRNSTELDEDNRLDEDDNIAGFKVRPLRPFVRINYKGVTSQTVTAIGCHPTWNHTLKLNSKLEPLSNLNIYVYDEYKSNIDDVNSEDEHSNKTVHYRYYNKWLGNLQVPLHTVLTLGTLRGTFKIATTPLLFGYETLRSKETASLIPEITQLMKKDTSYITLQITTSLSNLGGLHVYNQPLPSSIEDDYLIRHLNNFVSEYTNEFPTRNISLTFIDSAGRNKCVSQFLQPLPLPEKDFLPRNPRGESAVSKSSGFSKSSSSSGRRKELDVERMSQEERDSVYSVNEGDSLLKMLNACLRYVSLIPCYEITESHVVTLLGLELLKILHGSPLDHTILLASYLMYLGVKCWVAIGLGLPRGPSSYVLIKYDLTIRRIVLENDQLFRSRGFLNKNDGFTWYVCDASTGEKCELRDVGCPLKTVEYVFDNENIWVNMQTSQDCESLSFDFTRSSEWQPVFDKSIFVMKQPVMTNMNLYTTASSVEALRSVLETKIKGKFQKWRSHMKTIWNRYCSGLLRDSLPQWEFWAFNQTGAKPGLSHKLKQLMVTYKIFGFPLNMPYINTKAVVAAVKSTGLHATDDPGVEFALGVEVYAYPNNVISVWVFLVSITRI